MNKIQLEHPVKLMKMPDRAPDWSNNQWDFWWKEMMCEKNAWDAKIKTEPYKVSVCPQTGLVMLMNSFYPIAWHICTDSDVNEAYVRYSFEREFLDAQAEQEGAKT